MGREKEVVKGLRYRTQNDPLFPKNNIDIDDYIDDDTVTSNSYMYKRNDVKNGSLNAPIGIGPGTLRDGYTFQSDTIKTGRQSRSIIDDNRNNSGKNNNNRPNGNISNNDKNENNNNTSQNNGGYNVEDVNKNLPDGVILGTRHSNPGTNNTDWAENRESMDKFNENVDNTSSMDNSLDTSSIEDDTRYNSSIEGDDGGNYVPDFEEFNLYDAKSTADASQLTDMFGIHGLPYQFMSTVDLRLNNMDGGLDFPYGMEYTERIINRMPLLLLAPGRASFMQDFSKHQKETVFNALLNSEDEESKGAIEQLLDPDKSGRYYTFRFNYKDYFDFVNGMNWASAIYLGIGDKPFMGTTYKDYMWNNYTNDSTKAFFMGSEFVCFYVDSDNQVSDSFSNESGPSMLDSGISKLSDISKEVDFLLGAGAGVDVQKWVLSHAAKEDMTNNYDQANDILNKYNNPGNLMDKLKSGMYTIAGGGHLIFPEIYKDSTYSKSYSVNLKFTAPDGDTETIYKEIIVPLNHLHGMVLPMQMGYNGYRSPFLVKAIQKGVINIENGLITSMTVTKGGEGSWNVDGLPTEVNVSLEIKDMYQLLAMTKWKDSHMFFNNTQFLDFIATMSGVVICKPELAMKLDMLITNFTSKFTHIPAEQQLKFSQSITNELKKRLEFFTR